jgi:asparagine synthase (glutamine-hydrolysing)
MCGIAGFAGCGDAADLRAMTRAIAHRGPDAEAHWSEESAALFFGHRRLSVVDPEGGSQPMTSEDGALCITFNGEIYNHAELRETLEARGHRFASHHSDTEVLLYGYREWGEALVERLNGMWAFALFDRTHRKLFLSRDRFGQKPLYWFHGNGVFGFASELSALAAHSAFDARIDPASVRKYFAYGFVPAPRSIYAGSHKLPGGCNLSVDLSGSAPSTPRVSRWWQFRVEPDSALGARGEEELAATLRERFEAAVARRIVADVPVGVFLSGGIDSSSVAAVASRCMKPGELHTFSIGFDEASFDESAHAQRVADFLGSQHHMTRFTASRACEVWPQVAGALDEPMADASLLPTHLLCGVARRGVTVALGGDGADELFAGYDPFRALRRAHAYRSWVPRPLHQAIRLLAARLPTSHRYLSLDFKLKRTLAGLSYPARMQNAVWMAPLEPHEIAEMLEAPVDAEELFEEAIDAWDGSRALSPVDRTLQFFTRLYLTDDILTKVDRASMAHGLEVRSPFLDIELVDFVRRLPWQWKLRASCTKFLLRRAFAPWLPDEILRRPKQGFGIPVGAWLADARPPFDRPPESAFARGRLGAHRSGKADHRLYLYAQWMLDSFTRRD